MGATARYWPTAPCLQRAEIMLHGILYGLQVLVISDHADLAGEVLSLLENETGMHSCLEPKTQASPVGAGGKRRHPRGDENTGLGADKPEAQ